MINGMFLVDFKGADFLLLHLLQFYTCPLSKYSKLVIYITKYPFNINLIMHNHT